jgi:hypothetical protein
MTMPKASPAPAPAKRTSLATLKRERVASPHLILIHGLPGIGKSTFAAQFPDPIFLNAEKRGADELTISRWPDPVTDWAGVLEVPRRLATEEHGFKTLVIDKLDDIEPLCNQYILSLDPKGHKTMGEAHGGYDRAYDVAVDRAWRPLAAELERLQETRRMHVVLLAHATRRKFKDPLVPDYDRWEPNVHKVPAKFLVGWCRTVLFFDREIATAKLETGDKARDKVVQSGARVIRTERHDAYDAKNRLDLPAELSMGSSGVEAYAAWRAWTDPGELREAIAKRLAELSDKDIENKATALIAEAGDFTRDLAAINHRLIALLAERAKKGS